jgi:hypothetical protein
MINNEFFYKISQLAEVYPLTLTFVQQIFSINLIKKESTQYDTVYIIDQHELDIAFAKNKLKLIELRIPNVRTTLNGTLLTIELIPVKTLNADIILNYYQEEPILTIPSPALRRTLQKGIYDIDSHYIYIHKKGKLTFSIGPSPENFLLRVIIDQSHQ